MAEALELVRLTVTYKRSYALPPGGISRFRINTHGFPALFLPVVFVVAYFRRLFQYQYEYFYICLNLQFESR